jgi:HSP20 family protein
MNQTTAVNTAAQTAEQEPALVPYVDVVEEDAGITLFADLPGVPKDHLRVQIDAETLVIEGEIASTIPTGASLTHLEVQVPRYRRRFTLSRELDPNRIDASFQNGVLKLHIPKVEHAQTRRIEVQVA